VTDDASIVLSGGVGSLSLNEGRPVSLLVEGRSLTVATIKPGETVDADRVAVVGTDTPVRELLRQADASPQPMIVVDKDGLPVGYVVAADIIRALATRRG